MNRHHYCVIMAGGTANRFWPISREDKPKQFFDIALSGDSFVRKTYERCKSLVPEENILVVTLSRYAALLKEQIPELPDENLILEPYGRNTAPCIAYSTYVLLKRDPEAVVLVTPSDLVVVNEDVYIRAVEDVMSHVSDNPVLMTLGLVPASPDPNYGYIQVRGGRNACDEGRPVKVKTFTEKPDVALAEVFCKTGEFYWNSGIFAWRASVIKEEMERYVPEITSLFAGWEGALGTPVEQEFIERAYTDCAKVSIDHGVMEKSANVWMYPAKFGWMDVDSWSSLYEAYPERDADGNVSNSGNRFFDSDRGNIILSHDSGKLMAIKGLEDFIVVDTEDVLLICPKDDDQYRDFMARRGLPGYENFK